LASQEQIEVFTAFFRDQGLSAAIDAVASYRPPQPTPACSSFLRRVCAEMDVDPKQIIHGGRTKQLADLRHVAMWVCRAALGASYPEIGKALGGMDHTSVIHGVQRVEKTPRLRTQAEAVMGRIASGAGRVAA
jgi:hypothetical protein